MLWRALARRRAYGSAMLFSAALTFLSFTSALPQQHQQVFNFDSSASKDSQPGASTLSPAQSDRAASTLRSSFQDHSESLSVEEKDAAVESEADQFEVLTLCTLPKHTLRVKNTCKLCDPSVKQISGYLDISNSTHLFFWFFASRSDPSTDPLILWLNGGPGCSSSTGLLFENGPCSIAENGTRLNPYSWTESANIIYLDQPVGTGYSYSTGKPAPPHAESAAEDVYAFIQLLYHAHPQLQDNDFHIAAESYGGRFAPVIASKIQHANIAQQGLHVPLTSILLANGITEPKTQFSSVPDFACAPSPTAIFDKQTCEAMRYRASTCERLLGWCYDSPHRLTCALGWNYCWTRMIGPVDSSNVNPYDVRRVCGNGEDVLCYEEFDWIEEWLARDEVKRELGVQSVVKFESCNLNISSAYSESGDGGHNSAALLPEVLQAGIRVLVYAGDQDFMCKWIGNKRWVLALDSVFQEELNSKTDEPWYVLESGRPEPVGEVRSAGPGAGNFTFVRVYQSGHMVPHDQPAAALDLVQRWLANAPLT